MQTGYLYKNGRYWTLRYYELILENGKQVRQQKTHRLAPLAEYPNKTSVRSLADAFLGPINSRVARPESSQRVVDFLQNTYLPHVRSTLRYSTYKNYVVQFNLVRSHLEETGVTVHEFHTPEAEQLIQAALKDKKLAHTSHRNLKSFLSGAFKFAKRNGAIDRENPIADTSIPKGKRPSNTYAYSFDEVVSMLAALEEPCRTLVLVASLTGLRISEVLGLKWEDFSEDGDQLTVTRGVVNGIEGLTKNDASASVVPIVPPVRDALAEHKARTSGVGWVFSSSKGSPLWEQNLVRRDIKPKLKLKKIVWHGWHACRRGVGTILYELGILPVYIQAILRHADQDVTLKHYIKPVETATTAAMSKLADAFGKAEEKRKRA